MTCAITEAHVERIFSRCAHARTDVRNRLSTESLKSELLVATLSRPVPPTTVVSLLPVERANALDVDADDPGLPEATITKHSAVKLLAMAERILIARHEAQNIAQARNSRMVLRERNNCGECGQHADADTHPEGSLWSQCTTCQKWYNLVCLRIPRSRWGSIQDSQDWPCPKCLDVSANNTSTLPKRRRTASASQV
jgi:hypothetical protein